MKKVLNITYFILGLSILVFLVVAGSRKRSAVVCQSIQIQVDTNGDLFFVNQEMIVDLLVENQDSVLGKTLEDINIYLLEEFIDEHPNIEKAELYLTLNGKLCVDVKQRKPIARVFEDKQSYYLDFEINPIPLSDNYSARVVQVYWDELTSRRKNALRNLLECISQDEFLKAQITAIEFDENDEVTMYPRLGDHKIILGKVEDLSRKFIKLKHFYQLGLEKVGWERYSQINLKFENQVVCTKK